MISFNTLARIAKLVALLGFFLPWVLVSCSGNEIAHGSGVDMMTGHLQPNPQLAQMQAQGGGDSASTDHMSKGAPEIFVILAFALIVAGLLGSLLLRGRAASALIVATSVLAIGSAFYGFEHMHAAMIESANRGAEHASNGGDQQAAEMSASVGNAVAGAIRIEKQDGFWVTIGALAAAAVLALIALAMPASAPPEAQLRFGIAAQ